MNKITLVIESINDKHECNMLADAAHILKMITKDFNYGLTPIDIKDVNGTKCEIRYEY